MKRTKKFLVGLLATLSVLFGTLGLAACGSSNIEQDSDSGDFSQGLEYKSVKHFLSEETYIVSGIGECTDKDIVIPSRYNGKKVTAIAEDAFFSCDNLTSLTIGEGVTSISRCAFAWCSSLTSITIPDSVTSIGSQAFRNCENLASLTIGECVTSIGDAFIECNNIASVKAPMVILDHIRKTNLETVVITSGEAVRGGAFRNCRKLRSVGLPDGVILIAPEAFSGCESLRYITIPDSVTSIGGSAFLKCSSLTGITIGEGVTSIGDQAFRGCSNLTGITIPDGISAIGNYTFSSCESLMRITIPNSVTSIGDYAFLGCSSLTSITFKGTKTQWSEIEKGSDWKTYVCAEKVVCSDGEVEI